MGQVRCRDSCLVVDKVLPFIEFPEFILRVFIFLGIDLKFLITTL